MSNSDENEYILIIFRIYNNPEHFDRLISNFIVININHISHILFYFTNSNQVFHTILPFINDEISEYPPDSYPITIFCEENSTITSIETDNLFSKVVIGTNDGYIHIYNIILSTFENGIENALMGDSYRQILGHKGVITGLYIDNNILISGSNDRHIRVWDLDEKAIKGTYITDSLEIEKIASINIENNNEIKTITITVNKEGIINLWDYESDTLLFIMDHIHKKISFLLPINYNSICKYLIAIYDNHILLYTMNDFMLYSNITTENRIIYANIDDSNQLIVYDDKSNIKIYSSTNYPELKLYIPPPPPPQSIHSEESKYKEIYSSMFDTHDYVYQSDSEISSGFNETETNKSEVNNNEEGDEEENVEEEEEIEVDIPKPNQLIPKPIENTYIIPALDYNQEKVNAILNNKPFDSIFI